MAFEADCGVSTVLEAFYVTTTVRSPVPGGWRATCSPRDKTLRDSTTPTGGSGSRIRLGDGNS